MLEGARGLSFHGPSEAKVITIIIFHEQNRYAMEVSMRKY
jgi:hypothetical protein